MTKELCTLRVSERCRRRGREPSELWVHPCSWCARGLRGKVPSEVRRCSASHVLRWARLHRGVDQRAEAAIEGGSIEEVDKADRSERLRLATGLDRECGVHRSRCVSEPHCRQPLHDGLATIRLGPQSGGATMPTVRQWYGGAGVPLHIEGDVEAPAVGWRSQRARLREWLGSVPDPEWDGATRCGLWDMTSLVRHLASGSQFLGYTLHQASAGEPTSLLRDFDPHATVQAAAAMLGELTPAETRTSMTSMDASVDAECTTLDSVGWTMLAEAPPGQLPADLAVSHFLFDSWVHEYDLLVPRGERPVADPLEVEVVVRYLVGLASFATDATTALDVRLRRPRPPDRPECR